jgi:uncharacterized protein YbjT (DUF2867 family)
MILVTGAAGKTGIAVLKALIRRGVAARGYVHRQALIADVRALGAATSVGALDDTDALRRAAEGATAIYHIAPNVSPSEVAFGMAIAQTALSAAVPRLVFHSVMLPRIEAMPHHWYKAKVEALLFDSGLAVTVLQPTAYMQNLLANWDDIRSHGVFRVPYSADVRIGLVDLDDVAEVAAMTLIDDKHIGATYELVGTPAFTQSEVAAMLTEALGRPVRVEVESIEQWDDRTRAGGLGGYQRETLIKMFRYYGEHGFAGNPSTLRSLLGREPTSLPEFLRREVAHRLSCSAASRSGASAG